MSTTTPQRCCALALAPTLAGALALAGCGNDCPVLELCDVRQPGCQTHTAKVAACLSGDASAEPPVTVVDAQSFIEEQAAAATETEGQRATRRGLALLNLMPSEQDPAEAVRSSWSLVAAFYDPEAAAVTILNPGHPLDGATAVTTLLHEMIHAMQYRRPELVAREELVNTADAGLAWDGIIEGEAVLYQDLAKLQGFGFEVQDFDWDAAFANFEDYAWAGVFEAEDAYRRSRSYFPYAFGGAYVNQAWRQAGNSAVRALALDPPVSTRQLLAGHGAAAPGAPGWLDAPDAEGSPVLPPEFEAVTTLHLGAWLFDLFKARRVFAYPESTVLGSGLVGDVLSIFREPVTDDISVFWRLRFEDEERASDFVALLESLPPFAMLGHAQSSRDVLLANSTAGSFTAAFLKSLAWGPVEAPNPDTNASAAASSPKAGLRVCPRSL